MVLKYCSKYDFICWFCKFPRPKYSELDRFEMRTKQVEAAS